MFLSCLERWMGVGEVKKGGVWWLQGRRMDPQMFSITEAETEAGITAGDTEEELGHAGFLCQPWWLSLSLLKKHKERSDLLKVVSFLMIWVATIWGCIWKSLGSYWDSEGTRWVEPKWDIGRVEKCFRCKIRKCDAYWVWGTRGNSQKLPRLCRGVANWPVVGLEMWMQGEVKSMVREGVVLSFVPMSYPDRGQQRSGMHASKAP